MRTTFAFYFVGSFLIVIDALSSYSMWNIYIITQYQCNCRLLILVPPQTARPAKRRHVRHNDRLGLFHQQNVRQQRHDGVYITTVSLIS